MPPALASTLPDRHPCSCFLHYHTAPGTRLGAPPTVVVPRTTTGCWACLRSRAARAALPHCVALDLHRRGRPQVPMHPSFAPILSSPCHVRQVPCVPLSPDPARFSPKRALGRQFSTPSARASRGLWRRTRRSHHHGPRPIVTGRRAVRLRAQSARGYSPGRSASVRVHHGGARAHAPHGAPREALGNASAVAVGSSGRW